MDDDKILHVLFGGAFCDPRVGVGCFAFLSLDYDNCYASREMLARTSRTSSIRQEPSSCQFYWHRPLGATADCRRLTVTTMTSVFKAALWALPLSFDQVLTEMEQHGRRLDTLELDGTRDSFQALTASQWKQLVGRVCRCLYPRKVIFHGNGGGVSDAQRCILLQQMSTFIQAVELWNSLDHEDTLRLLQTSCHGLVELRLINCAALQAEQIDILLHFMYKKQSPLRALSLHGTPCWDDPDTTTLRRFCNALEHSAAALEEAEFGSLLKNNDDDVEMKEYLSVITKLHRMRHYYYKLRQHTDLSAFSVADNALSVVQHWWQLTHRPHRDKHPHDHDSLSAMDGKTQRLSRHSSNLSTDGSC